MEIDLLDYPRPQMARPRWFDLGGPWDFAYDDWDRGCMEHWEERDDVWNRTIIVPFPPESPASGIGDTGFHPIVWYRRRFTVAQEDREKVLLLHCEGIDYRASVWVNGHLVGTHEGGQVPFTCDLTTALRAEDEQVLVVRAEDVPTDLSQPRGKQDWRERPQGIWYERTTGIWRPIWMEAVPGDHISSIRWSPDLHRTRLGVAVELRRRSDDPLRLRVQLSLKGMLLVDDTYTVLGTMVERDIPLDNRLTANERWRILWSPRHPNLIDARLTLLKGEEVIDEVWSYAGLRSVGTASGRFLLNDRPYYLRLVLDQGYWPESHLAAPSGAALRREVELAKELGFNGVRMHQKVADPRFLYWCDRLGLLVWGEMANAYVFTRASAERLTREWMAVIARDYSHPCIVTWVPVNESWGVPDLPHDAEQRNFVRSLFYLTKALDPTRPVIANDGWEYLLGDIIGIHDYSFSGATLQGHYGSFEAMVRTLREVQPAYRFLQLSDHGWQHEPIVLTEFGGIGYEPEQGSPWYGYGTVRSADEYLEKYRELVGAALDSPVLAGFCYTQLTDTGQETNGLLTADRVPTIPVAAIRAINQRPAAAVPPEVITQMQEQATSRTRQTAG